MVRLICVLQVHLQSVVYMGGVDDAPALKAACEVSDDEAPPDNLIYISRNVFSHKTTNWSAFGHRYRCALFLALINWVLW